jgi:nitrogen fixation protein
MTIKVTYNVTDVYVTQDVSPVYINVSYSTGSSGGSAVWGGITGTLSDQTDLQSALDLKVPYTGATTNVNLGEYEIKAGQVTLDTSPTGTAAVGTTRWNDTTGLSETTLKGGTVVLKNGVDLVARVVNKVTPNTTLTKAAYQAVRVSGAQGQRLAVAFAQANNDNNSADTIGLVTETIATNQEGFIITVGQLENINTTGSLQGETWVDGDVLYLSPTTAGALTNVKPNATIGHIVVIGYVEYAHAVNGKIYVKVMNGWELGELHDVYVPTPSNNDVLTYETSSGLWKNKSVGTALGYTPANAATTLTINGVTYDLSANRSWSVGTISGSGASGQVAYWTGASSQSGSNNLFWDATNSRLGIGTNAPAYNLHVTGNASISQIIISGTTVSGYFGSVQFNNSTTFRTESDFSWQTPFGVGVQKMRLIGSTGNLLLQNGGTFTDNGQRLQVQGTTLLNGNVTFSSATGMFWDATNSRLGIGTNAPSSPLHIVSSALVTALYVNTGNDGGFTAQNNGTLSVNRTTQVRLVNGSTIFGANDRTYQLVNIGRNSTEADFYIQYWNGTSYLDRFRLFSTGNFGIGTGATDSGERLQVTGTMKVTGNVTSNGSFTSSVTGASGSFIAYNPGPNYPRAQFEIGNTSSDINVGLIVAPSTSSPTLQKQSALTISTNRDTSNASSYQIGLYVNTTTAVIYTANRDLSAGAGAGVPLSFQPSGTEAMRLTATSGNLLIGTTTDVASSILTLASTTKGFLPPRMTTTQKNAISSPAAGLIVYDTTDNKHYGYNGTTWNAFY